MIQIIIPRALTRHCISNGIVYLSCSWASSIRAAVRRHNGMFVDWEKLRLCLRHGLVILTTSESVKCSTMIAIIIPCALSRHDIRTYFQRKCGVAGEESFDHPDNFLNRLLACFGIVRQEQLVDLEFKLVPFAASTFSALRFVMPGSDLLDNVAKIQHLLGVHPDRGQVQTAQYSVLSVIQHTSDVSQHRVVAQHNVRRAAMHDDVPCWDAQLVNDPPLLQSGHRIERIIEMQRRARTPARQDLRTVETVEMPRSEVFEVCSNQVLHVGREVAHLVFASAKQITFHQECAKMLTRSF